MAYVLYPPLDTEVTIATVSAEVTAGNQVKVGYTFFLDCAAVELYHFVVNIRLYRDGIQIFSRDFRDSGNVGPGTGFNLSHNISHTFVDTAPVTTTSTYEVRVITELAFSIDVMSSGRDNSIDLLII